MTMTPTVESRNEKKERMAIEAAAAWADYSGRQKAIDANTERLRALRLAREAQPSAKPTSKPKKQRAA